MSRQPHGVTHHLSLRGTERRSNPVFSKYYNMEVVVQEHCYFVYILTNHSNKVLYTGVTNNLERRLYEHRNNLTPGFASKYRCHKLVWYETTQDINAAIAREKQIKGGSRARKMALIEGRNPGWADLAESWTEE